MASRSVHGGLFLISLATLTFEILLTRIFSVTIWNHFAFFAISTAMFGLAAGSLCVYLFPARFPRERTAEALTLSALASGVSMVVAVSVHLSLPFELSDAGLVRLALMYTSASLPFFFCGIAVCLSLTRFPNNIGTLYCADLVGAAFGCLMVVGALELFDAPTAVLLASVVAASSGLFFSRQSKGRFKKLVLGLTVVLILSVRDTRSCIEVASRSCVCVGSAVRRRPGPYTRIGIRSPIAPYMGIAIPHRSRLDGACLRQSRTI